MSRADDIVRAFLADAGGEAEEAEWRRLTQDDPAQVRAALLLLQVEGLLHADAPAPAQAAAVMARLDAQVGRRIRTSVMGELHKVRHGRWRTTRSGRHARSRPRSPWHMAALAAAACVLLAVGLAAIASGRGASPQTPDAVASASRLVEVLPPVRLDGISVTAPASVRTGSHLVVDAGGSATLAWVDGTRAVIAASTALTLADGDGGKRLDIGQGRIAAVVAPQPAGRPMVLATPHGEALVVGTRLRLEVDATTTRLTVDEGLVRLVSRADGSVQEVAAGRSGLVAIAVPRQPVVQAAQHAIHPALDLSTLVRAQAAPERCAPFLVAGEGPSPEHQTVVRVFDRMGMCASQFLAWPPSVRGGVAVAALRLPGGVPAIACAAGDAATDGIRIVDATGAPLSNFTPAGVKPPFAIAAGAFIPGQDADQIAVAQRTGAQEVLLCRHDGQVLARWPLPASSSDLVLAARRSVTGDRLLHASRPGEDLRILGPDGDGGAVSGGPDRERVEAWHARRWIGDRAIIHASEVPAPAPGGSVAGLWQAGFPDAAARTRLDRLAAAWRQSPDALVGVMPGPPTDAARWRPSDAGFADFLLRRRGTLAAINAYYRTSFPSIVAISPPAGRGRGAWDRLEPGNALFLAWQHYGESAAAERLFQGARDAVLAGFPPDRVLLPVSPRAADGLPRRSGAAALYLAAGTGLALDCGAEDLTAPDGLLAVATSSGHGDPVLFQVRPPLPRDVDRMLLDAGVRFFPAGTGFAPDLMEGAHPVGGRLQVNGPARSASSGGNWIVQLAHPERPPRLVGVGDDGSGNGDVLLSPFRTRFACDVLWPDPLRSTILEDRPLVSPVVRNLGPGDLVEVAFRARAERDGATVTVQVVRSDAGDGQDPLELPEVRQVFTVGRAGAICHYALRAQILTGPVQVAIRAGTPEATAASRPRIVIDDLRSAVHRSGAALPDVARPLGRPYHGPVSWDVFPGR